MKEFKNTAQALRWIEQNASGPTGVLINFPAGSAPATFRVDPYRGWVPFFSEGNR